MPPEAARVTVERHKRRLGERTWTRPESAPAPSTERLRSIALSGSALLRPVRALNVGAALLTPVIALADGALAVASPTHRPLPSSTLSAPRPSPRPAFARCPIHPTTGYHELPSPRRRETVLGSRLEEGCLQDPAYEILRTRLGGTWPEGSSRAEGGGRSEEAPAPSRLFSGARADGPCTKGTLPPLCRPQATPRTSSPASPSPCCGGTTRWPSSWVGGWGCLS